MNRIEFVGNALFIPFFLIGVGMLIDYKAFIKDGQALYVAGIIVKQFLIEAATKIISLHLFKINKCIIY